MQEGSPRWGRWAIVTVGLGLLAFLASPGSPLGGFWGTTPEAGPQPSGSQIFLFIFLGAIQSLVGGLGVAFLIFGFPLVNSFTPAHRGLARLTHLAIAWSLLSWWPHGNFHQTLAADNIGGLLAIEYGFHLTLIIAGLIVAYFFGVVARQTRMQVR